MARKNILIAGSNGMLGKDMVRVFTYKNLYNVYGISRAKSRQSDITEYTCDLTDFKSTKEILEEINPDIIINCAANINLDSCEKDKESSYITNAEVSGNLASYKPLETKYIYISTDSVFDGISGNYKEDDETNPLNYYAYTKLEGERSSLKQNPNSIIIRTNIYGFNIPAKNSLVEWALNNFKTNNGISGFKDVYFNPLYTKQLAEVSYRLIKSNFKGLINVGCKQKLSKYEFLVKLSNQFGINSNLIRNSSVDTMNFKTERPKNTTLNTEKIQNLISINLDIDDGIQELYEDYMNK